MTIKVKALHECDKRGCNGSAQYVVTFTTRRGQLTGPRVCEKHVGWGKQRAREIENS